MVSSTIHGSYQLKSASKISILRYLISRRKGVRSYFGPWTPQSASAATYDHPRVNHGLKLRRVLFHKALPQQSDAALTGTDTKRDGAEDKDGAEYATGSLLHATQMQSHSYREQANKIKQMK